MRRTLTLAVAVLVLSSITLAAEIEKRPVWGYAFFAAGASFHEDTYGFAHVGGGGEGLLVEGLGIGMEFGVLAGYYGFGDDTTGVFAPGAVYAFRRGSTKMPFINGGYAAFLNRSFFGGPRTDHGAFIGGGLNYWLHDHFGLRVEGRDQIRIGRYRTEHFIEFRIGVTFR